MASSGPADRTARRGYWFPLLLFGALAALALSLSVLASPRVLTGVAVLTREVCPTVMQAMYFGGGSVTAARVPGDRAGAGRGDRRTAPAWGTPGDGNGLGMHEWAWLDVLWRLGTFPLLAIAVSLGVLARIGHSRVLAVITVIYTAAVCLTGWFDVQQTLIIAPFPCSPVRGPVALLPAALLPAAVLLLAGLGASLAAGLRARAAPGPGGLRSWTAVNRGVRRR